MNNKFTIIIPTRERCDTLEWTLKTCVEQDYDNLEILVSDNFSQDKTFEVVTSFQDPRIKYINTNKRVSMSHNWEFALSNVTDGYVTFIGDDDGILKDSVKVIGKLITDIQVEAFAWRRINYSWPDHIDEDIRNYIILPFKDSVEMLDSKDTIKEVISFSGSRISGNYDMLPCLYNSFVSMDIINKVKSSSGKFFNSMIPDIYSGFAVAGTTEKFAYSYKPYSISGISKHSTGTSYIRKSSKGEAANKYLSEENIPFHESLVMTPSISVLIMESFLQAKRGLKGLADIPYDLHMMIKVAAENTANLPSAMREEVMHGLVEIERINNLEEFAQEMIKSLSLDNPVRQSQVTGYNFLSKNLYIRAPKDIKNIYDATIFCNDLMTNNSSYLKLVQSIYFVPSAVKWYLRQRWW